MKYDGRAYAQDPDIRWRIADAVLAQDGAELQVFALARDVDEQVDHGARWFAQLVGLKVRATESARVVVDDAIRVSGGGSYFSGNELGRLYRDVLAGIFHPSDDESAHATVADVGARDRRRPDVEMPDVLDLRRWSRLRPVRGGRTGRSTTRCPACRTCPRWTYYPADVSEQEARARIARSVELRRDGRGGRFVVETGGVPVGTIGLAATRSTARTCTTRSCPRDAGGGWRRRRSWRSRRWAFADGRAACPRSDDGRTTRRASGSSSAPRSAGGARGGAGRRDRHRAGLPADVTYGTVG